MLYLSCKCLNVCGIELNAIVVEPPAFTVAIDSNDDGLAGVTLLDAADESDATP